VEADEPSRANPFVPIRERIASRLPVSCIFLLYLRARFRLSNRPIPAGTVRNRTAIWNVQTRALAGCTREWFVGFGRNLPLCFWLPVELFLGEYGSLSKFLIGPRCCANHRSASWFGIGVGNLQARFAQPFDQVINRFGVPPFAIVAAHRGGEIGTHGEQFLTACCPASRWPSWPSAAARRAWA
jgi:hypothetical protein